MMTKAEYLNTVFTIGRTMGYGIELNHAGQRQIIFGHKKLYAGHLSAMYPDILADSPNVSKLIDKVAPGRPCAHKPMKEIIRRMADKFENLCH